MPAKVKGGWSVSPTWLLIAIMSILLTAGILVTNFLFYKTALDKEHLRLSLVAQSQARLIEAVARFNAVHFPDYPGGSFQATLSQVHEAQTSYESFGETGEFSLAKLEGDEIVFLIKHHPSSQGVTNSVTVKMGAEDAEPMAMALQGKSGTKVGRDYHGDLVLAAYEPVRGLGLGMGLGIVAKIDVNEIRAPYYRIGRLCIGILLLLAVAGVFLFRAVANPLTKRMAMSEERYRHLVSHMGEGIMIIGEDEKFSFANPAGEMIFGLETGTLVGRNLEEFLDEAGVEQVKSQSKLRHQGETSTYELRIQRPSGEWRDLMTTVSPSLDDKGKYRHAIGIIHDITEQKQAADALRESEGRYREIIESMQGVAWDFHPSTGLFTHMDPLVEQMFGYPTSDWNNFADWVAKIHPDDRENTPTDCLKKTANLESHTLDYRAIHQNGNIIWVHEVVNLTIENGEVKKIRGIFFDVTKRKLAEKELQEVQQKLRAVFDQTFQFIGVLTPDGTLVDANMTSIRFAGLDESEIIGKPFWETPWWTHSQEEQQRLREAIKAAADGEFIRFETSHRSADGDLRVVDFSLKPVMDDQGQVIMLIPEGRDITEQKQIEQALGASREIIEASPVVAFIWENKEGWPTTFVSDNVIRIFGYSAEEFLTGKVSYMKVVHPDDLQRVAGEVDNTSLNASLNSLTHEPYRIVTKSGQIKWLEDITTIIRNPDGRATQCHGIVQDITGRRQAEEARLASETSKRTILSTMNEGFWLCDTEMRNLEVNPEMCRILGREEYEILGRKIYDFVDEKNEQVFREQSKLRATGESGTYEISLSQPNGTLVPCLIHATPLVNLEGVLIGSFAMVTDMTEQRKQAEEIRLMALFGQHNPAPLFRFDKEGKILSFNPAASQLLGDAETTNLMLSDIIPELAAEKIPDVVSGSIVQNFTSTIKKRVMTFTVQGIPDLGVGHAYGVDITELINARRRAEQANEAKVRFIASMSHELRTPLSIITGSIEILQENTYGQLNEKQQKYVQSVSNSSTHLLAIINDLLDLAKIEAGKLVITKTRVDLTEIINSACSMINESLTNKGLKLRTEGLSKAEMYLGDSLRLRQVVLNLLSNSVKFTSQGTITVYLQRSKTELTIGVKDTGTGIEPEFLSKLFIPFEQGKDRLYSDQKGTGLGLALSREIVRAHGGEIKVKSEVGVGSNFMLVLPVSAEKEN